MGCCQITNIETEAIFTQVNSLTQQDCDDNFNEVPLSSSASPLRFRMAQEEHQYATTRQSYELTNNSNYPYTKHNLELAFVYNRLREGYY